VTRCSCSKNDGHLSEVALETVLPGTPDKIYNLMFASGFIKDFMKVDQKLIGRCSCTAFVRVPKLLHASPFRRPDVRLGAYQSRVETSSA
jgi:hypothetical protein